MKNLTELTILLESGTIGKVSYVGDFGEIIGTTVCVELHDENGTQILESGIAEEILEVNEY